MHAWGACGTAVVIMHGCPLRCAALRPYQQDQTPKGIVQTQPFMSATDPRNGQSYSALDEGAKGADSNEEDWGPATLDLSTIPGMTEESPRALAGQIAHDLENLTTCALPRCESVDGEQVRSHINVAYLCPSCWQANGSGSSHLQRWTDKRCR
eukprot:COSAG05_NODE_3287_length_2175_cov_12.041777_1_plen_153_part_00